MRISPTQTTSPVRDNEEAVTTTSDKTNLNLKTRPTWRTPQHIQAIRLDAKEAAELSLLRKEESRLLSQTSKLKLELDQIKQARGLETSERDAELLALIGVWRSASQQAAEELYGAMRDKVNALGGMKRWSEMEKERRENVFSNWDTEEDTARKEGKLEDDEVDEDEIDIRSEANDVDKNAEQIEVEEPESFTMDVMLKYLGIRLEIFGYDSVEQRWIY